MTDPAARHDPAFHLLSEHIPAIVWTTDLNLRITSDVGAGLAALGERPGGFVGVTIPELFEPGAPAIDAHRRAIGGDSATYEQEFQGRIFRCHIEPMRDDGRIVGVAGVALDVTSEAHALRLVREEQTRYRALVEHMPAVVFIDALDESGTPVYMSPQIEQLVGYTVEEWMASPGLWRTLVHPEDRERVLPALDEHLRTGRPYEQEYRMLHRDGRVVWVHDEAQVVTDDDGRLRFSQGFLHDITARKETEARLRQTNQALRALIEASPLAIAAVDLEGKVTLWNPAAERMFGWTEEEVLGRPVPTIPAGAEEEWRSVLDAGAGGAVISAAETRRLRKDGSTIDLEIARAPIRDARGRIVGILGIFTDIRERKWAEEALRTSEERYRELFENANDIIYTHDLDGRITSLNKAAERSLGYPRDRLLGASIWKLVAPEHVDRAQTMLRSKLDGKATTRYELDVLDSRGRRVALEINTRLIFAGERPVGVQGIARDVTERRRAEESLRRSERQFRSLIDNALDVIAVLDENLTLRFGTPSLKRVLGYAPDELAGRPVTELLHPDDVPPVMEAFEWGREHPREGVAIEVRARHRDGSWRVLEGIGANLLEDPDVSGIVVNARDVTERKRYEDGLRFLTDASEVLASSLDLEKTLTELARLTVPRLADWCVIQLAEDDGSPGRQVIVHVDPEKEEAARRLAERYPTDPRGPGAVREVLTGGRSLVVSQVPMAAVVAAVRDDEHRSALSELGMGSAMIVPLSGPTRVVGTMTLITSDSGRTLTEADLGIAEELGHRAGGAVENARLFHEAQSSEDRFRQLVEGVSDYALFMIDPDGRVASWHPTAERIFGYAADEIVGEPAALLFPDDERAEGLPEKELREATELERIEKEGWRLRKDGTRIWVVASTTAIRDIDGTLRGFSRITRDITERKRAHEELERSLALLRRTDEERRRLLAHLVRAQEEERTRIAADVHDDSLQVMVAVGMRLEMLERRLPDDESRQDLGQLRVTVADSIRRLRALLFEVRPPILDIEGLAAALRLFANQLRTERGLDVEVDARLDEEPPEEIATIAYRIGAEALQNVRKHARATRAAVVVGNRDGGIVVRIEDDGVGFPPDQLGNAPPGHLGIVAMRERAEVAGGWCRIESEPGTGTTVEFWLPLPDGSVASAG